MLLFANPYSQTGRDHHSIRVSFDDGMTWPRRVLLDIGRGAGYPSLSRAGKRHVGLVYEGSGAKLVWGCEAVAVENSGRANPNQLRIGEDTIDDLEQQLGQP